MVAPVNMTQDDREQWLGAAVLAIRDGDIPPDKFAWAAGKARLDPGCDHPAKIVPSIMRVIGDFKPKIVNMPTEKKDEPDPKKQAFYADMAKIASGYVTQEEIDAMPLETKRHAHALCLITSDYEGRYWIPGKRPVAA